MTFSSGCIIADSAEIGLLITSKSFNPIITTCLVSFTSSLTQINLSLSRVKVANPIEAG